MIQIETLLRIGQSKKYSSASNGTDKQNLAGQSNGDIDVHEDGDDGVYCQWVATASISQFRDMLAERTPFQKLSEKSKPLQEHPKKKSEDGGPEKADVESKDSKVDDQAIPLHHYPTSSDLVWREEFTRAELKEFGAIFYSSLDKTGGGKLPRNPSRFFENIKRRPQKIV